MKKMYHIFWWTLAVLLTFVVSITGCSAAAEEEVKDLCEDTVREQSAFCVRFLDVGQADAALVECDGRYMLIDGGDKSDSEQMYATLKAAKIEHLDLVVGTHPDMDHIGGLAGALNYATTDLALSPVLEYESEEFQNFRTYVKIRGGEMIVPEAGDTYSLGSAVVEILALNSAETSNDTSIVLKITYGDTSFLFMGDGEAATEQALLNSGKDLCASVLKVAHHGSSDSSAKEFLNAVSAEYAIISVGENTYFHPTKAVLERLDEMGAKIYRTDLQGEIRVVSDGKTIEVTSEREAAREEILTSAAELIRQQEDVQEEQKVHNESSEGVNYAVNTKNGKIHIVGKCPATGNGESAMKSPRYFSDYEEAYNYAVTRTDDISEVNCGTCW